MTALRTVSPIPPGVEPDFDGHIFDADRDDNLVKCPACGGRGQNILSTTSCDLCDGEGRVAL